MASLIADNNAEAAVQPTTYNIQVKFKANKMNIPVIPNSTTLFQFQSILEERTGIEAVNQKLLLKGKQLQNVLQPNQILYDINVDKKKNFIKFKLDKKNINNSFTCNLNLVGNPTKEIEIMNEHLKRDDRLMRNDLTAYDYKSGKLFGTNGVEINNNNKFKKKYGRRQRPRNYGFQHIEPLPQFEDKDVAEDMLNTIANNPGVLKVMEKHHWKVPVLKELYPDGKVGETDECIMGLNKNNGEEILLRIRTDDLKGFRKMESVLNVLYHELAHNEISEHNNEFKALNSLIKKEALEMDWTRSRGHRLGDAYSNRHFITREQAIQRMLAKQEDSTKNNEKTKKK
jgi:hypothetical protein